MHYKHSINGTAEHPIEHLLIRETLLTPRKHADPKTSVLRTTVVDRGKNHFELRLASVVSMPASREAPGAF